MINVNDLFGIAVNSEAATAIDPFTGLERPTYWLPTDPFCFKNPIPTISPTPTGSIDCGNSPNSVTFWNLTNALSYFVKAENGVVSYNEIETANYNCVTPDGDYNNDFDNDFNIDGESLTVTLATLYSAQYITTYGYIKITHNFTSPTITSPLPFTILNGNTVIVNLSGYPAGYNGVIINFSINCSCLGQNLVTIEEYLAPTVTVTPTPTPTATSSNRPTYWVATDPFCFIVPTSTPTPTPYPTGSGEPCPVAGTPTGQYRCVGTRLEYEVHDGNCGVYWVLSEETTGVCCEEENFGWIPTDPFCLTFTCLPPNILVDKKCVGMDLVLTYTDGECGTYDVTLPNSALCCPTPTPTPTPTDTPTPTPTPTPSLTYARNTNTINTKFLNYTGNPAIDPNTGGCVTSCIGINVYYFNGLPAYFNNNPQRINTNNPNPDGFANVEIFDNTLTRSIYNATKYIDNTLFSPIYITSNNINVSTSAVDSIIKMYLWVDNTYDVANITYDVTCMTEFDNSTSIQLGLTNALISGALQYEIKACCNCESIFTCAFSSPPQRNVAGQYVELEFTVPNVIGYLHKVNVTIKYNGINYVLYQFYYLA